MTKKMWQAGLITLVAMTASIMATPAMGEVVAATEITPWESYDWGFEFAGGVLNGDGFDLHFYFSGSLGGAVNVDAYGSSGDYLGPMYVFAGNPDVDFGDITGPVQYLMVMIETGPVDDLIGVDGYFPAYITVGIDVKPGSTPNTINLGANGVIPVAILSSPGFDPLTVDPATVQLEGKAGVRAKGNGTYLTEQRDVNGDGRIDLIVKIETQNLNPGDIQDGLAEVTGQTTTTPPIFFKGVDEVTIVPQ